MTTDRTKVDISKNMTICCENCLNDDNLDWYSSCVQCSNYSYFLGLKEDKRYKCKYKVVVHEQGVFKSSDVTAEELLSRIEDEKKMRATQRPMFNGLSLDSVYNI